MMPTTVTDHPVIYLSKLQALAAFYFSLMQEIGVILQTLRKSQHLRRRTTEASQLLLRPKEAGFLYKSMKTTTEKAGRFHRKQREEAVV